MRPGLDGVVSRPGPVAGLSRQLRIRQPGLCDYLPIWQEMQAFTRRRGDETPDELWLLQHRPVFTLGMNGKPAHVLSAGDIPVLNVDRGGQVTYHGPGQLVAYVLLDLRRLGIGVRGLVTALEQSVVEWLQSCSVTASVRRDAPGVYVDGAKVAALGLRVRRGCSYHGLAINVDMDLTPFDRINPCGYAGMPVTQLRDLGINLDVAAAARQWLPFFSDRFRYVVRQ